MSELNARAERRRAITLALIALILLALNLLAPVRPVASQGGEARAATRVSAHAN